MKRRIICDTCSAIKLAEFGDLLFHDGKLTQGSIILHPTLFAELKKWHPDKKKKFQEQIQVLNQVKAATGLRLDRQHHESQEVIIRATRDALGLSVGKGDLDQLVSVIYFDLDLITNDSPLASLASNLDVTVFEAEEIVVEALDQKIVTKVAFEAAVIAWEKRDEKRPSKAIIKAMLDRGIKYK